MIAAAYIRVSTEDQIEFSPDSQLKRIQEYANQHNMQIPETYIFIDEGLSGRTAAKRPAFQQMISLARQNQPFQKILVWKYSRFARSRQDSIFYKSMLRKECGIEVISITEPLNDDPTSILVEALLEAMDEYYSINLAQEVRRGMQERFSRGMAISIPPFGYLMGTETFIPHPIQAPWVQYMFEAYAKGDSLSSITQYLNQRNIRTKRGNPFQTRTVSYILMNPVYIGKLRKRTGLSPANGYDRNYIYTPTETVSGTHPPIVSDALWQQVQTRWFTSHPQSGIQKSSSQSGDYFLKNLVFCSNCGRKLIHIQHGTAFQCSGYNHGNCKVSHYIKSEHLEQLINDTIIPQLPPMVILALQRPDTTPTEKNRILREVDGKYIYQKHSNQITISAIGRT